MTFHPKQLATLTESMKKAGISITGGKVLLSDLRRVFGAKMTQPEWIVLHDYQQIKIPQNLIDYVQAELSSHRRALLPTSMKYADFGTFLDKIGNPVCLCALVFQYSVENSPRNVCFGYKLFDSAKVVAENNSLATSNVAITQCMEAAKVIIETELFDL